LFLLNLGSTRPDRLDLLPRPAAPARAGGERQGSPGR
jgi:hypothetical protein